MKVSTISQRSTSVTKPVGQYNHIQEHFSTSPNLQVSTTSQSTLILVQTLSRKTSKIDNHGSISKRYHVSLLILIAMNPDYYDRIIRFSGVPRYQTSIHSEEKRFYRKTVGIGQFQTQYIQFWMCHNNRKKLCKRCFYECIAIILM